jgi:hypothetical protein
LTLGIFVAGRLEMNPAEKDIQHHVSLCDMSSNDMEKATLTWDHASDTQFLLDVLKESLISYVVRKLVHGKSIGGNRFA